MARESLCSLTAERNIGLNQPALSVALEILKEWISSFILLALSEAPRICEPFDSASASARLDSLLTSGVVASGTEVIYLNTTAGVLAQPQNLIPVLTLNASSGSILDLRATLEEQVFSGIPVAIGVRIRMDGSERSDPHLILTVAERLSCSEDDETPHVIHVRLSEVEFGNGSAVVPRGIGRWATVHTDHSKVLSELSLPVGKLFNDIDFAIGEEFRSYLTEWHVETCLSELRGQFLAATRTSNI